LDLWLLLADSCKTTPSGFLLTIELVLRPTPGNRKKMQLKNYSSIKNKVIIQINNLERTLSKLLHKI